MRRQLESGFRAEAVCREIYAETRALYAEAAPRLGRAALGFRILYGPPVVDAPYLFIGHQPGGRDVESPDQQAGWPAECQYAVRDWRYAKLIRHIFGEAPVARSTGLNGIFFRAPSVAAWSRLPGSLRRELEAFSLERTRRIVEALRPRRIIVIGLSMFDRLGCGEPVVVGRNGRVFAKEGEVWGAPASGVLHLTGSWFTVADRERLREHFHPSGANRPARPLVA